jgi:hypothetical protein
VGYSLYRFCCSLAGKLQALLAISQLSFFLHHLQGERCSVG